MLHMRALILCAGLVFACPSLATTFCPGNAGEPLPLPAEMSALAARLAAQETACGNDPGFLAYRGAVLLQLGQAEAAAALLERALMLAPDLAGAQADYARALAYLGDRQAARSLLVSLTNRTDVPPALRPRLQRWQAELADEAPPGTWQTGGSLAWRIGGETNLNSAPALNRLDLTLPEGNVSLPLSANNQAQGGAAHLLELTLKAGRQLDAGGRLQLLADLRGRQAAGATETNYQQLEALAVLTQPVTDAQSRPVPRAHQLSLGISRLDYGGEHLYSAGRLGYAHIFQLNTCIAGGSLEAEARQYPAARNLDGLFAGAGGSLRCPLGPGKLSLIGRLGLDKARDDRPGGDQSRWDLRLAYDQTIGGGRLETELNLSRQQDSQAYSTLLANGARRHIDRIGLRAEWSIPWQRDIEAFAALETSRQNSNLNLFDITGSALWLGGRWRWGGL